ncbi:MAG: hypothetical protein HY862_20145 [Chloroflexi bacterium]|nr:hypothetical protein [Chloroflexota bacterium]
MPNKNYTPKPRNFNPGEVGYRNRGNRTGLDPFDTSREAGRMEGLFYRNLIRGTLRTRNPILVLFLLAGGVILIGGAVGMVTGIYADRDYYDGLSELFCVGTMIVLFAGLGLLMLRASLTNAVRMSGLAHWWHRQFKKTKSKKARKS